MWITAWTQQRNPLGRWERKALYVLFSQRSQCAACLWGCTQSCTLERGRNASERSRNLDIKPAPEKTLFCSRLTQAGPGWITCGWPRLLVVMNLSKSTWGPTPVIGWLLSAESRHWLGYVVAKHQHRDCFCLTFERFLFFSSPSFFSQEEHVGKLELLDRKIKFLWDFGKKKRKIVL